MLLVFKTCGPPCMKNALPDPVRRIMPHFTAVTKLPTLETGMPGIGRPQYQPHALHRFEMRLGRENAPKFTDTPMVPRQFTWKWMVILRRGRKRICLNPPSLSLELAALTGMTTGRAIPGFIQRTYSQCQKGRAGTALFSANHAKGLARYRKLC